MKLANKIFSIVLVVLLVATIYGLIRTGRGSGIPGGNGTVAATGPAPAAPVDQTPLLTAQAFASMPTSAVELPFARAALQLGDQEMDLAFALAVLDATQHPPSLTAKAKEIQARLQKAQDALAAEQAHVAQLTAAEAKASGAQKNKLDDQLKLAQAQLELDQDEVDDAKEDLIRAGGGLQDRIQAMSQEHEAASQASDATKVAVSAPIEPHGLIQRFQQWSVLHQKQLQLWRAKQEALSAAAALAVKDDSLERQLSEQATGAQNDTSTGSGVPAGPPSTPVAGRKRATRRPQRCPQRRKFGGDTGNNAAPRRRSQNARHSCQTHRQRNAVGQHIRPMDRHSRGRTAVFHKWRAARRSGHSGDRHHRGSH